MVCLNIDVGSCYTWTRMPHIIQVISLLATWTYVHTAVRTVYLGATVTEPVLKAVTLNKDDQLIASNNGVMCAQYFCCNRTCHNSPTLVSHFQIYSGNLCFIIPNVTFNDSGQYDVVLNGIKNVLNFTLHVEEFPQQSIVIWLILAIAVFALVGLILVIATLQDGPFRRTVRDTNCTEIICQNVNCPEEKVVQEAE